MKARGRCGRHRPGSGSATFRAVPVDPCHAFAGGQVYARPRVSNRLAARLRAAVADAHLRQRVGHAWASFDESAVLGDEVRLGPAAYCFNIGARERVRVGSGTVCRGILRRETFGDGELVIGDSVYIGDDCIVSCSDRVEIGALTLLGHGVQIYDNNSHPLDRTARAADWRAIGGEGDRPPDAIEHAPVHVGAGCWLGFGSTVLRGVTIGEGAVVAAGSIVTSDVEPYGIVAGSPAAPIRALR
jgi:acetyltransferase-like isoleucine patch superfamily enzyme